MNRTQVYTYIPKIKYKMTKCALSGFFELCTWHHINLRNHGKEWTWVGCRKLHNFCELGLTEIDDGEWTSHNWIHEHPEEAKKLGLYKPYINKIMKKTTNSKKWRLDFSKKEKKEFKIPRLRKKSLKDLEGMKPADRRRKKRKVKKYLY